MTKTAADLLTRTCGRCGQRMRRALCSGKQDRHSDV